ncbi:hypothetical protein BDQ17DRAFT_1205452, partial [Cyathus striatus]
GSFNKVFSIQFSNGFRVAAHIPQPRIFSSGHIESTVAMMTLAQSYRNIPTPKVFAWNLDNYNPVGAPYMLLEWVEGVKPWQQWHDLSSSNRIALLDEL